MFSLGPQGFVFSGGMETSGFFCLSPFGEICVWQIVVCCMNVHYVFLLDDAHVKPREVDCVLTFTCSLNAIGLVS